MNPPAPVMKIRIEPPTLRGVVDRRPAVGANPPQRFPIVGVMVGEHGDHRILADVAQPLKGSA